jgi:hypothetical protein
MKLMGPHHHRHKDGSNGKSSRTSPSKLEGTEFFNDNLFASNSGDFREKGWYNSLSSCLPKKNLVWLFF